MKKNSLLHCSILREEGYQHTWKGRVSADEENNSVFAWSCTIAIQRVLLSSSNSRARHTSNRSRSQAMESSAATQQRWPVVIGTYSFTWVNLFSPSSNAISILWKIMIHLYGSKNNCSLHAGTRRASRKVGSSNRSNGWTGPCWDSRFGVVAGWTCGNDASVGRHSKFRPRVE